MSRWGQLEQMALGVARVPLHLQQQWLANSSTDTLPSPQVQVGSTPQDQRIVGYIACTHLHAPPGRPQPGVFWVWVQYLRLSQVS